MIECARMWFALSNGLYVMFGVVFVFGILAGFGLAPHLPHRLRSLLGV